MAQGFLDKQQPQVVQDKIQNRGQMMPRDFDPTTNTSIGKDLNQLFGQQDGVQATYEVKGRNDATVL